MPIAPFCASTRRTSSNAAAGSGRWKIMNASTATSMDPFANGSRDASPTSRLNCADARPTMPGARSMPTTVAAGACSVSTGSNVPTPVPTSRTRRAAAIGSRSSSFRLTGCSTWAQIRS
jgi:hypothetical protein